MGVERVWPRGLDLKGSGSSSLHSDATTCCGEVHRMQLSFPEDAMDDVRCNLMNDAQRTLVLICSPFPASITVVLILMCVLKCIYTPGWPNSILSLCMGPGKRLAGLPCPTQCYSE